MSTPLMQNAQRQLAMYDEGFVHGVLRMLELQLLYPDVSKVLLKQALVDALTRMEVYERLSYIVEDLFPDPESSTTTTRPS